VHDPAAVMCTVAPLTVQFPLAAKETASPDDADALTVKSASPYVLFASAAKEIDCGVFWMKKVFRSALALAGWRR
jgi:hypothetical protein